MVTSTLENTIGQSPRTEDQSLYFPQDQGSERLDERLKCTMDSNLGHRKIYEFNFILKES